MTIADRFEQMPMVEKTFIAIIVGVLMIPAGLLALALLLVIVKVGIFGVC